MRTEDFGPLVSWEEYQKTGQAHRRLEGVFSFSANLPSQVRALEEKARKILTEQD